MIHERQGAKGPVLWSEEKCLNEDYEDEIDDLQR